MYNVMNCSWTNRLYSRRRGVKTWWTFLTKLAEETPKVVPQQIRILP